MDIKTADEIADETVDDLTVFLTGWYNPLSQEFNLGA
jgi:hypothetical protein